MVAKFIVTVVPASAAVGVYVKLKGDVVVEAGVRIPSPAVVIVTVLAFRNVLPLTVIGDVPQVLPDVAESVREGGVAQPQATLKELPAVVQSEVVFLTVITWLPSATPAKVGLAW